MRKEMRYLPNVSLNCPTTRGKQITYNNLVNKYNKIQIQYKKILGKQRYNNLGK